MRKKTINSPCVILTLDDSGNNFPDLVLVPIGDGNNELLDVTGLLTDMVLRDLKRLVNKGAVGVVFLKIGCNIHKKVEHNWILIFVFQ